MTEPVGEPTYSAGETDRRDTETEPHVNSRLGEAAGQGEDERSFSETDADPAAGDPSTGEAPVQRQEDEGGRTDPA